MHSPGRFIAHVLAFELVAVTMFGGIFAGSPQTSWASNKAKWNGKIKSETPAEGSGGKLETAIPSSLVDESDYSWEQKIGELYGQADKARSEGQFSEAESLFNQALKIADEHPIDSFFHQGIATQRMMLLDYAKQVDESKQLFEKLWVMMPDYEYPTEMWFDLSGTNCFQYHQYAGLGENLKQGWDILKRPVWGLKEQKLVWAMLADNLGRNDNKPRMVSLAGDVPQRTIALAWALAKVDDISTADALLNQIISNSPDEALKLRAKFYLFENRCHLADWRGAEKLWTAASKYFPVDQRPRRLAQIAVFAGNDVPAEGMRLWQMRNSMNPTAGLRCLRNVQPGEFHDRLVRYYTELSLNEASTKYAQRALAFLRGE